MPGQYINTYILQAVKDVRGWGSQDAALVNVFERIQSFFRLLEYQTEVRPTTEMKDTTIQILAEVLSILGIVTKEIKEGILSK